MKCANCAQEVADNDSLHDCTRQILEPSPLPDAEVCQDPNQTIPLSSPPPYEAESSRTADFDPKNDSELISEEPPPESVAASEIRIDKSAIRARQVIIADTVHAALDRDEQQYRSDEEKPLYDFVTRLPQRSTRLYEPGPEELSAKVNWLRDNRLLLISSPYPEFAFDAAWAVIEGLPGSPRRFNGMLSFQDVSSTLEFSLPKLFEQRPEAEAEGVLLVDALPGAAESFPTSFLGHSARADSLKQALRNERHFLVVIVDFSYARRNNLASYVRQDNLVHQIFPYWEVPFLEPFMKRICPNQYDHYLREIARQRQRGLWEKEEDQFAQQILSYYHGDRLLEVIDNGGPKDPASSAESLLNTVTPVDQTVLYAGTFFQDITSPEFCHVVEALLNKRTTQVAAPANEKNREATEVEVPLLRIWAEKKDEIFTRFLVETTGASRTVNLAESNLREPLRKLFEKRHRYYLLDQFRAIQETGLFFHPSQRIGENTTRIAVELAFTYPEEFNEQWIVGLVMRLRKHLANESADTDPMFKFLSKPGAAASNLASTRIRDVCQRLLASPQHKRVVTNSLEDLMSSGCHEQVLSLIKYLKFSEEFDDWYWLKQLLHRADSKTRYQTYLYMISYLKRMGMSVYDGLTKVSTWLPPADRKSWSEFDSFVFRLLIKYCLDTIARFDPKHYGKWPSRYPLFAIDYPETVESHTAVLAGWLLHPGVEPTLAALRIRGTRMTLIGGLLAEWTFILLGPGDATAEVSCQSLFHVLLRQFVSRIDLKQRLDLLKYWNQLHHELFRLSVSPLQSSHLRQELEWKRNLVRRLTEVIKNPKLLSDPVSQANQPVKNAAPVMERTV
jgi:hypothetical protein